MTCTLVFDIETNGLRPTKVHCLVIYCVELDETFVFADQPGYAPITDGLFLLQEADWLIAHNGLDYDIPVLERLYPPFKLEDRTKLLDTVLLARIYFPELTGHKLKDWGHRLGLEKGDFGENTDWQTFSTAMCDYCVLDVDITTLLHQVLMEAAKPENTAVAII